MSEFTLKLVCGQRRSHVFVTPSCLRCVLYPWQKLTSIVGTSGNLGLAMRAVHHHLHSQVDFYATCSSITTSATSRNVKRPFDQGLKPLLTSWNPKDCTNSVCWLLSYLINLVDVDEIKNLLCLDYWLAAFLSQIVSLDYVRSLPKISLP